MGIIRMHTRYAIIKVDGKCKYIDIELALSDSELSDIQTCAKCGNTGIDTYDFTIKGVHSFWHDLPAVLAQSDPDGLEVIIDLKCRK